MDFQQLLAKMVELDRPVGEECGSPMGMPPPMDPKPPVPEPSMSVNLNAQGMDNIESLMKLMTKVNPDMINQPTGGMPPMPGVAMPSSPMPSISAIGSMGNLDAGPLKMLPDLDKEPEGDHSEPDADNFGGPSDNDADNIPKLDMVKISNMDDQGKDDEDDGADDMGDNDDEEEDDEEKKEWANSQKGSEPFTKGLDAAIPDGNDLNKPKKTFPKVSGGDNPMQKVESIDLRSQIRAELLRRLNEAKSK
jgi:hypothetical protein